MKFRDFLNKKLPDANYSNGEKSNCPLYKLANLLDPMD